MSSTARGTTRDPRDFYPTPIGAFQPLLDILPKEYAYYDPCEGDGRLVAWMVAKGLCAAGNDLFPQTGKQAIDFLTDNTPRDFINTNPPFSVAQQIADHAIQVSQHVLLLLPLNFLGSDDRKAWWKAHEPDALHVLSSRPGFVMACTCKTVHQPRDEMKEVLPWICGHSWMLPADSKRPKECPECGGKTIRISTSDSCNYGWFYFGKGVKLWTGIHHL